VALPARFLVLLPGADKIAVSRRIEKPEERERLASLLSELHPAGGLIVRTAAESRPADEFTEDLQYLSRQWSKIEARLAEVEAPNLVHQDLEPALRMVRDLVVDSFEEILVQDSETYNAVVEFLELVQPGLAERVRLYKGDEPLFDSFDLEQQFDAALRSKVWLKSGGYLVINPTEALVAIDINTGRFTELQGELAKDRARSRVLNLSDFGLVEITRKRSHTNLRGILTEPCPDCQGSGRVKSATTLALAVRREILRQRDSFSKRDVLVTAHPSVAEALRGEERDVLALVEQEIGKGVQVRGDDALHREQFEVQAV
jgi:ribonuclease G